MIGSATQNWSTKKVEIVCGQGPYKIQVPESKIETTKNKFQNSQIQKIQIQVFST